MIRLVSGVTRPGPAGREDHYETASFLLVLGISFACRSRKRTHTGKESGEFPKPYSMTYSAHSVKVVGQIVDRVQQPRQPFSGDKQVPQVRARVPRTNPAATFG